MADQTYEGWVSVYASGTDYEADLVRDRLDDAGVPAVVLTQRDHAFNLNVGDLASVHVMVKPQDVQRARGILESDLPTDEELEAAALSASPAPDAHAPDNETRLDSGNERIDFSTPDEDDEERT